MKTLFRVVVPLLATLSIGCINGSGQLTTLYGFDYAGEFPIVAGAADTEPLPPRTACRPMPETSAEATPVVDPFLPHRGAP